MDSLPKNPTEQSSQIKEQQPEIVSEKADVDAVAAPDTNVTAKQEKELEDKGDIFARQLIDLLMKQQPKVVPEKADADAVASLDANVIA